MREDNENDDEPSSLQHNLSLTTKPHAFGGTVLTPKNARELTPSHVLTIIAALSEASMFHNNKHSNKGIGNMNGSFLGSASLSGSFSGGLDGNENQPFRRVGNSSNSGFADYLQYSEENEFETKARMEDAVPAVQYTLWITKAWDILNWGEPSAGLFWEMATMFHTLHVADRSRCRRNDGDEGVDGNGSSKPESGFNVGNDTINDYYPPILPCSSASSVGTSNTNTGTSSPNNSTKSSHFNLINPNPSINSNSVIAKPSRKNAWAVAKELPVWLLGTFLLLHCEDQAFARNVSGEDERRFDAFSRKGASSSGEILQPLHHGRKVDFSTLLTHPSLSPRTRIHAQHHHTGMAHSSFVLTHLRKFLLFIALPHNAEALAALKNLIDNESPRSEPSSQHNSQFQSQNYPDPQQINEIHDRDHGNFGHGIYLTNEDLDRLSFILHAPNGGLIDDPPILIHDFFSKSSYERDGIDQDVGQKLYKLEIIEKKLRYYIEEDLNSMIDNTKSQNVTKVGSNQSHIQNDDEEDTPNRDDIAMVGQSLSKLSISNSDNGENDDAKDSGELGKIQRSGYEKELIYKNLSQKSIFLKPHLHPENDNFDTGSAAGSWTTTPFQSGPESNNATGVNNTAPCNYHPSKQNRLHDLTIADCNDVHMYLLQAFENVTISACTGCHIVIGAVAGLLHIVDCERTTITSASRRAIVSNSFEVLNCIFTPSPPVLVGDNRSCQFAPYNTYYDGLRDDLLATGLAAQVVDSKNTDIQSNINNNSLPNVQCASNKWNKAFYLSKLEPQVSPHGSSSEVTHSILSNSGEKSPSNNTKQHSGDDAMPTPFFQPPSEFQILFVPLESEATLRRRQQEEINMRLDSNTSEKKNEENQYCRNLADILQLSPFHLPYEYEKRVIVKAERMRSLQQAINTDLPPEKKTIVEEELNKRFREWLVSSGNLRQILDLVHMEKNGVLTSV